MLLVSYITLRVIGSLKYLEKPLTWARAREILLLKFRRNDTKFNVTIWCCLIYFRVIVGSYDFNMTLNKR